MAGTWHGLVHQPTFNTSTMILLSDGRIMVQEEATAHWHALAPDSQGSYIDGTWSPLADMSFWRRYYASGMLKDGRIVLIGGEQSGAGGDTNKGEIEVVIPRSGGFNLQSDLGRRGALDSNIDLSSLSQGKPARGYKQAENYAGAVNGGGPIVRVSTEKGHIRLSQS